MRRLTPPDVHHVHSKNQSAHSAPKPECAPCALGNFRVHIRPYGTSDKNSKIAALASGSSSIGA